MNFVRFILICCFLLASSLSQAASVSVVKGQRVMIETEGEDVFEGDEFFLINPETQKKAAIISVRQVKGQRAIADILKGKAAIGYTLQAKAPSSFTTPPPSSASAADRPAQAETQKNNLDVGYLRQLKDSYGITGGYLMNTMSADVTYRVLSVTQKTTANMAGTGFGVTGFYDRVLADNFTGHAVAGLEQFNVAGDIETTGCNNTTSCNAKITYLSAYALGKWYPMQGKYRPWVGGGVGFLLALTKSSTALNESQISSNQVFTIGGGVDIQMSRKNYIPVSIEYNLFPSSSTVKASMILIKGGWAWNL